MTTSSSLVKRGRRGQAPAPLTQGDEAALDFFTDVKNQLLYAQMPTAMSRAASGLKKKGIPLERTTKGVAAIREAVHDIPTAATWLRMMRSSQDINWNRCVESVDRARDQLLRDLDDADKQGPGSVTYDPTFEVPDYAKVEIHTQPGGYVGDPLAGYVFDLGTGVFYGGAAYQDRLHRRLAEKTEIPLDQKVERVMDIGCSIGQYTCGLKERFPAAEVWGSDISAPLVRYAHKRAVDNNHDVHFAQMPAEALDYDDSSFDLVTAYILFHEVPVAITDRIVQEVYRILRPGGTFVIWDFPSDDDNLDGLDYTGFLGVMDAADNCEPYSNDFVRCGFDKKLKSTGFQFRYTDPEVVARLGRVCDKPAGTK